MVSCLLVSYGVLWLYLQIFPDLVHARRRSSLVQLGRVVAVLSKCRKVSGTHINVISSTTSEKMAYPEPLFGKITFYEQHYVRMSLHRI
jgi:hypothetical protein